MMPASWMCKHLIRDASQQEAVQNPKTDSSVQPRVLRDREVKGEVSRIRRESLSEGVSHRTQGCSKGGLSTGT